MSLKHVQWIQYIWKTWFSFEYTHVWTKIFELEDLEFFKNWRGLTRGGNDPPQQDMKNWFQKCVGLFFLCLLQPVAAHFHVFFAVLRCFFVKQIKKRCIPHFPPSWAWNSRFENDVVGNWLPFFDRLNRVKHYVDVAFTHFVTKKEENKMRATFLHSRTWKIGFRSVLGSFFGVCCSQLQHIFMFFCCFEVFFCQAD